MPYFNGFRLRWWSKPLPRPCPPSENDSDSSSSPERVERHISLHITSPKNPRHSIDRAWNVQRSEETLGTPPIINKTASTSRLSHEVLSEKSSTHLEQPAEANNKVVDLLRSSADVHKASSSMVEKPSLIRKSSSPMMKDVTPSLIRRVTSKLRITVPPPTSSSQPVPSVRRPSHSRDEAGRSSQPPRSPRNALRHSTTLPNSFVSRANREAALRERGLRPPRKDLSEQEREADERLGLAPLPVPEHGESGSSAASRIREEWLSMNRSTESGASGPASASYPNQLTFNALASGITPMSHSAPEPRPRSSTCDSDCARADLKIEISFRGRSSVSSSVPPLEVLQEEPVEPVPPTQSLCSQPPIVISTPVEDSFPSSSPAIVESPVSCSFSSHLAPPGSFLPSHPSLPTLPEKENSFPIPPVRRRTTISSKGSHSSAGTSLSKFGTNSLSNLRRSVIGSIGHSGSSANLSISSSQRASPRTAISPTMHNRASILLEAGGIRDAESRRLSELAFLD